MTRKISFSSSCNNDSDFESKVLHAEVKHNNFLVQQNVIFAVADHLPLLYRELFPDSKIAKKN